MRLILPEKKLHCYDTFSGIALADSSVDYHKDGEFFVSFEQVKSLVGEIGVEYHVGIFPDTFLDQKIKPQFSFVHVDTDTYHGTKAALEHIFPCLSYQGILLFDDYRWHHCPGVQKAIKEWLLKHENACITRTYSYQIAIEKKRV